MSHYDKILKEKQKKKNGLLSYFQVKKIFFFILAVLGLCCCSGFSLVVARGGYSPVVVQGLLIATPTFVAENGL